MSSDFDVVVIGAGLGGLTCGAFLARAGMKVLVVEEHYQIGGYAHSFKRGPFRFESGIHSVAMASDGFLFHLLRLLGIDSKISVVSHDSMYAVSTPKGNRSMPISRNAIFEMIARSFPNEKVAFGRIIDDMERFYQKLLQPAFSYETDYKELDQRFLSEYYNLSYSSYIKKMISDSALQNILFGQWPFVGSSPAYAPVTFNLLMYYVHLKEGSHYIQGGFKALVDALASAITDRGGAIHTRQKAVKLCAENGSVRSIILDNNEEIHARIFVSNISPFHLHGEIIEEKARNKIWLRRLRNLNPSVSGVAVYLGLKTIAPVNDGITMWYAHEDHEKLFERILTSKTADIDHLVMLAAPKACEEKTMCLLSFEQMNHSTNWKEDKKILADKMVKKGAEIIPGLDEIIERFEIGSPSTFERFTGNTDGALYGFENTKSIYGEAKLPTITYLDNLYQVGHWGKPGGGAWNVMLNGYTGAKIIEKKIA